MTDVHIWPGQMGPHKVRIHHRTRTRIYFEFIEPYMGHPVGFQIWTTPDRWARYAKPVIDRPVKTE